MNNWQKSLFFITLFLQFAVPVIKAQEVVKRNQYLPQWSPDGKKYSCIEVLGVDQWLTIYDATNQSQLVSIELSGLGQIVAELFPPDSLTSAETQLGLLPVYAGFSWAPDSERYVFINGRLSPTSFFQKVKRYDLDLYIGNLNGEVAQLTFDPAAELCPRWSPDGKFIAYAHSGKIRIQRLPEPGGVIEKSIASPSSIQIESQAIALFPEWASNSQKIAFSVYQNNDFDLFTYDFVSDKLTRLTHTPYIREYRPVWSPDAEFLAFHSVQQNSQYPFSISIAKVDITSPIIDSLSMERLSETKKVDGYELRIVDDVRPNILLGPAWMPGGRHIVYIRDSNDSIEVAEFNLSGIKKLQYHKLETGTKENSDIQCAKNEAKLIFSHYAPAGGGVAYHNLKIYPLEKELRTFRIEVSSDSQKYGIIRRNQDLPQWSPDGEKYACVETWLNEEKILESQIKIYSVSGEIETEVAAELFGLGDIAKRALPEGTVDDDPIVSFFSWAPDNEHYVFTNSTPIGYDLFIGNLSGKVYLFYPENDSQADLFPRWSPNKEGEQHIAYMREGKIFLRKIKEEDGKFKPEEKASEILPKGCVESLLPEWSPDGKKLAFSALTEEGNYEIYLYEIDQKIDEKNPYRLTDTPEIQEYHPVWSPDGEWIAIYSKHKDAVSFGIAIIKADKDKTVKQQIRPENSTNFNISSSEILLANSVHHSMILGPAWMPSSRHLVYVRPDDNAIMIVEFSPGKQDFDKVDVQNWRVGVITTQLNADIQCSPTESKLIFSHYALAGGGVAYRNLAIHQLNKEKKEFTLQVSTEEKLSESDGIGIEGLADNIKMEGIYQRSLSGEMECAVGGVVKGMVECRGYKPEAITIPILHEKSIEELVKLELPEVEIEMWVVNQDYKGLEGIEVRINDTPLSKDKTNKDGYIKEKRKLRITHPIIDKIIERKAYKENQTEQTKSTEDQTETYSFSISSEANRLTWGIKSLEIRDSSYHEIPSDFEVLRPDIYDGVVKKLRIVAKIQSIGRTVLKKTPKKRAVWGASFSLWGQYSTPNFIDVLSSSTTEIDHGFASVNLHREGSAFRTFQFGFSQMTLEKSIHGGRRLSTMLRKPYLTLGWKHFWRIEPSGEIGFLIVQDRFTYRQGVITSPKFSYSTFFKDIINHIIVGGTIKFFLPGSVVLYGSAKYLQMENIDWNASISTNDYVTQKRSGMESEAGIRILKPYIPYLPLGFEAAYTRVDLKDLHAGNIRVGVGWVY